MNTNMEICDAHGGTGRGGGREGRGGCGCGPFQTGHWWSTDGQEQFTNGGHGARGGRGKQRGGRRGGSVDSRQYDSLPSALSTGAVTSISTGAAPAFSTGALAASAAVFMCTDASIATGSPAAAAIATGAGATITTFAGATIATGAIANTAAVSTGAFAVTAAVFMGVPALPPPRGRQTSDHPLDAEKDISTAASAIASAAGTTSTGIASATVEYDSLSRRAQMIILMDRKASNASTESLSASYIKNMYDSVMRQCDAIIVEVVREKPSTLKDIGTVDKVPLTLV